MTVRKRIGFDVARSKPFSFAFAPVPLPQPQAVTGSSTELSDGSILCAAYSTSGVDIYKTTDRGLTWSSLSAIPGSGGYTLTDPCLYRTVAGDVMCLMRAERSLPLGGKESVLASARSTDGGATWSAMTVHNAQMTGPCHALRLHNSEVMLSYKGYARWQ